MTMHYYDERREFPLYRLIGKIDENPILFAEPLEASRYLNIYLSISSEGFRKIIEPVYDQYLRHMVF